ncbi:MAG: radical SAM protein [Thermoanaerobaculia bacterium]|nr:radical SAM protein [Thermoanaerobaculia bacterium]
MDRSLYLINPKSELPSYFGAESFAHFGLPATQSIADLCTATVAAMAPREWRVEICDEYVDPIDFDHPAEWIGLTGKITQGSRMLQVADEFRRRGKRVVIGGPYASLSPEVFVGRCDVLVVGEMEEMAPRLFADLASGDFRDRYEAGEKPDLTLSPRPRWDLYPNDRALFGCVQTSRGCPFECEFCDVIEYLGRKQRHKSLEQITAELDALYDLGYRQIFLADDNFTAYRKRAKAILARIAEWNRERAEDPVAFGTQVSIDAARDAEIMSLSAEAGMTWVFIGIETPNEESLRETKKRQNLGVDLRSQVEVFLEHGIAVTGGMIVGFDHDGLDIFERQHDFAMSLPVPMFSLGALVAPAATPLFDRLRGSGRLVEGGTEVAATPWDTNILPTRMTRDQLLQGLRWLCNRLYRPQAFAERVLRMIDALGPYRGPSPEPGRPVRRTRRTVEAEMLVMLKKLIRRGPEERRMWAEVSHAMAAKPEAEPLVLNQLVQYAQVRCLYETGSFWEPRVAERMPDLGEPPPERLVGLGSSPT